MRCFVTRINGFAEEGLKNKQEKVSFSCVKNGFLDMAIFVYDGRAESNEGQRARFDGIIAGVSGGDIACVQLPTGNGYLWDRAFINHLKVYGVRVIGLIHALEDMAADGRQGSREEMLENCKICNAVIASSKEMYSEIKEKVREDYVYFHENWNDGEEGWLDFSYYTNKVINLAIEDILKEGNSNSVQIINDSWWDIGANILSHAVVRNSLGGNHAVSYKYEGNADGIVIRNKNGIVYETDDLFTHYALIPEALTAEEYVIEAYVQGVKGKVAVATSGSFRLSQPNYNDASPLISIVIPAYNSERLISRTIDSIIAQSQEGIELVVVDDGSTDNTAEVIKWYSDKYTNVKLLQKENGGQASARNYGIAHAKGKYIGFADNDDLLPVDAIELLYNAMVENDADIACGNVEQITANGHFTLVSYPQWGNVISTEQYLKDNIWVVIWNKLYKSEICKKITFGTKIGEDCAWTPAAISYANRISYVNKCVYEWDQSRETQNSGWYKLPLETLEDAFDKIIRDTLEKYNVEKEDSVKEYLIKTCNMNKGRYRNSDALIEVIRAYKR